MSLDEDEKSSGKKSGGMADMARKILLTGLGAIFMTEASLRKGLGDLKIPKDAMGGLLNALLKQKDDLLEIVATELSKFLSKIKVHEELQKALAGLQVHIDAKLHFDKKGSATPPAKISIKR